MSFAWFIYYVGFVSLVCLEFVLVLILRFVLFYVGLYVCWFCFVVSSLFCGLCFFFFVFWVLFLFIVFVGVVSLLLIVSVLFVNQSGPDLYAYAGEMLQVLDKLVTPGDLNLDEDVDEFDLEIFADAWLDSCSGGSWCNNCDIDRSGTVDFIDFAIMANNWF